MGEHRRAESGPGVLVIVFAAVAVAVATVLVAVLAVGRAGAMTGPSTAVHASEEVYAWDSVRDGLDDLAEDDPRWYCAVNGNGLCEAGRIGTVGRRQ